MQPEKLNIKFEGKYSLDLRDLSFGSQKMSKIIVRAKQTLYPEYKKEKEDFIIKVDKIEEGSLIIEVTIFLQALYQMLETGLTIKEIVVGVFDAIDKFKKIWDIITSDRKPEIKSENGMINVYINGVDVNGDNNNVNIQPIIVMLEPTFRTAMASEKELNSFAKQMEEDKLKSLKLDEKPVLSEKQLPTLKEAIKAINYLKNQPIKNEYQAEVKIFEYNKKSKTGKLEIINTDLFQVKHSKSVPFYIDENNTSLENEILQSMIKEKELIVKFNPIINDQIDYKELKKMYIIDVIYNYSYNI